MHGGHGRCTSDPAARGDLQLRHRPPLVRPAARTGSGSRDDMRAVLLSAYREVQVQIPVRLDRRQGPRLLRLPRPAQRRARAVQGRHPLPPGGRPRRGARARLADDLEDRDRRHPVRRREGRRQLPGRRRSTQDELETITRSFIDKIDKVSGPTRDIPAPDVNTNAQVMAWMMDEYGKLHGHTPAIVTGKPIALEGSYGREAATGRGLVYLFREAAPGARPDARRRRAFVVQGFGNVGSWAARIMQQLGATLVAVSDAHGAIRNDGRHRRRRAGPRTWRDGGTRAPSSTDAEPIDAEDFLRTRVRGVHPRRARRHDPRRQRRPARLPRWSSRARTRPTTPTRRRDPRRQGRVRRSPTSWPTPAASSSPTSSGCRTSSTSAGTSARSTTGSARSCAAPTARCGARTQADDACRCASPPTRSGIERVVEAARLRGYI